MFSLSIWNRDSNFKTLTLVSAQHPVHMGLSSDFILISTPPSSVQRFGFPQNKPPVSFNIQETVTQISCNNFMALLLTDYSVWLLGRDMTQSGLFGTEEIMKSEIPVKLKILCENRFISASLSDCHAAVICTEGLLYTWGQGTNGELGHQSLNKANPTLIQSASIFKATQVLTGPGHTSIITSGGYLYIYSKPKPCSCGPILLYPYTLPSFESFFISKAVNTAEGIAVLTNTGKLFISKLCLCTYQLNTNKKISEIVSNANRISALSSDKTRLYVWETPAKEHSKQVFELKPGKIFSLFSGADEFFGICGVELDEFPGRAYQGFTPPEASPKYCEQDKKSIEQLLERYNFGVSFSRKSVVKEEACKEIVQCMRKYLAEGFRKVKEFGYVQRMMQKAYVNSLTLGVLAKVWGRNEEVLKEFAFGCIKNSGKGLTGQLNPENLQDPISILEKIFIFRSRIRFFIRWSSFINHSKYFDKIKSVLNLRMRSVLSALFRNSTPNTQLKYGFHFLMSTISKLQTKQKSYSFNSILRQKSKQEYVEHFGERYQILLRPWLSFSFHQIKVKSITQKHTKIIRLILSAQSLMDKFKYRMIIKGFSSFKKNSFNKSILSDFSSEKSFGIKNFCKVSHKKCESYSMELTMPNTERSTLECSTISNVRRASLHNFDQKQEKKYLDRVSIDQKPSILMKSKVEKNKNKESRLDKRKAYHETLKERQRRKIISKVVGNREISQSSIENFDAKKWIARKYLYATGIIGKILSSIVNKKIRLPFNLIKYSLTSIQPKNSKRDIKSSEKGGKLKIRTKYLEVPKFRFGLKGYDSPVESPITLACEDNFSLQRSSFEMASPKIVEESQPSLWKIKLYTLGLKKFVRTYKMLANRKFFSGLKNKS